MQSTGNQKFTVYYYIKTELYDPENPWSENVSDASFSNTDEEEGEEEMKESE